MLEGLEATEVKYSEILTPNRIDSEYYKKEYLSFFQSIPNLSPLSNFVKDGYRVVYENTKVLAKEVSNSATPYFLQATDISTPFIHSDRMHCVQEVDWDRYPMGHIQSGEILIEVKGKAEKVAIVPEDIPFKTLVSGSLYKLTVNEKISKFTLLTYLISKYGDSFKQRYKTNTLIGFISKSDLYRIPVPQFSSELQTNIDALFKRLFDAEKEAKRLYSSAESCLLECLGMQDFVANPDAYNIKTLKGSFLESGRIDAEYYLPKYEELTSFIQNYSLGCSQLSDIVDFYRGSLIADTYYTDYDTTRPAYIRGGDISSNRIVADNMVSISSEFIPSEETTCIEGDIIMAMIGSVGTASIVSQDFSGSYISNNLGLLRLRNPSIRAEVLHLYLTSPIGKMFFTQRQMVTAQPKIAFRDIENIPIPLIRPEVQAEIAQHIQRSFALRKEASQLLEEAKLSVEQAIEIGGGKLLIYNELQENINKEERLAMYLLLKELGLINEKPQHYKVVATEKKLSASFFTSGRLDAEYYQPKYDYLDSQLAQLSTKRLGELVEMRKSIEPGSDAYQTEGIPFVRVSDLNKFGLETPSVCLDRATYATAPRPQKDTILLSKDGSVGIAYKVETDMDVITSGAILHLSVKEKEILPDYLTLVLNSPIVKMQAERDAGGSIIQHWKPSEIEQVVIPILPPDIQQKLSEQVSKSFALRREAGALLAEAKAMVERAIEATA